MSHYRRVSRSTFSTATPGLRYTPYYTRSMKSRCHLFLLTLCYIPLGACYFLQNNKCLYIICVLSCPVFCSNEFFLRNYNVLVPVGIGCVLFGDFTQLHFQETRSFVYNISQKDSNE